MQTRGFFGRPRWLRVDIGMLVLLCLSGLMILSGCEPSGDSEGLRRSATPSVQVETQAVESLVQLYGQAVLAEDIDRLQTLLAPDTATSQTQSTTRQDTGPLSDAQTFRRTLSAEFRTHTLRAVAIPPAEVQVAADRSRVTFLEVTSLEDPTTLAQHTRVYRTTFMLSRTASGGRISFRIASAQRQGPLVEITSPGQVQAGALTRLEVQGTAAWFPLGSVEIVGGGMVETLRRSGTGFHTAFVAALTSPSQTLPIHLHSTRGEELVVTHRYRLRTPGDGVVQQIAGTGSTRLFAVEVAPDGTVWAGGDLDGSLYRVSPGGTEAQLVTQLLVDPDGRVEDLVVDALGRLHAVVFSTRRSGVVVHDQGMFCQTVNVLDDAYPLRTADGQPSPSTRVVLAGSGAIWLHGSDGGITRVTDGFRGGVCPSSDTAAQYASVFRREDGTLPTNTVPAMLAESDGTLWVGSALGLVRIVNGELTLVPFDPELSFDGNVVTLEAFFQAVARAIVDAEPIEAVSVGDVSFVQAFGSALVKEDLIFSLAKDLQSRIWVGTLGGGIRRVEVRSGTIEETLHLKREDGLSSDIIFALALAPDGAIWAATDEGVSRIQDVNGTITITTFSAVDGLALPARAIEVDASGTAWVATDGGLYRIDPEGGQITGVVQDEAGNPVDGADVVVLGTSLHAVTDAEGRFTVPHVPSGSHRVQVDGRLAVQGPLSATFRDLVVSRDTQTLLPVVVRPGTERVPVDVSRGGQVAFPLIPGAAVDIPPGALQFPSGTSAELTLTLLQPNTLPATLPRGFTAVASAEIAPDGVTFTAPVGLTLPNQGQVPAGRLVILLRLDDVTRTYQQVGLGRVSADGVTIATLSGGLTRFSTVVFAATAEDATKVFLRPVSGNNQRTEQYCSAQDLQGGGALRCNWLI